jgi:hypothetical protein
MPTRLPVLLHKWKSASAGTGISTNAAATSEARADVRRGESKALDLSWAGIDEPLGAVNDNGSKIIDVGARRTCFDKVADPGKKTGGIVVRKKLGRIEAKRPGPFQGGLVDRGPRRIVRGASAAVGAVGVAGQR